MQLEVLLLTPRSMSLALSGPEPYEASEPYELRLNGRLIRRDRRKVQSLFDLLPGRDYELEIRQGGQRLRHAFSTPPEDFTLNVRDFGARGDGENDDTQAIQAALYACPANGRVLVPAGRYNFTSLYFKSHTRLEMARGAVLAARPERSGRGILPGFVRDYKGGKFFLGSWEGNPLDCFAGLFTLIDVEDVLIYGEGTLAGGGSFDGWWQAPKERRGAWRPRSVFMQRCRNIALQGITIKDSPSWTIHPMYSENLAFVDVSVINPQDSPNTDGINPEACRDVRILGCRFSLGDDCIALKSGKIYMARETMRPCEQIEIRHCLMENGHGGLTIGSEMAGGVRRVTVSHCVFRRTDRGLRIKTRRGRGRLAVVSDISFEHILMDAVPAPFVINMFYFCDPDGHSAYVQSKEAVPGPPEALPEVGALCFRNIKALNCSSAALFAYGLPEKPIAEIALENVELQFLPPAERRPMLPAMLDDADYQTGDLFYVRNVEVFSCRNVHCRFFPGDRMRQDGVGAYRAEESVLPPAR